MIINTLMNLTQIFLILYGVAYSRHLKRTKIERKLSLLESFTYYSSILIIPLSALVYLYVNWN